MKRKLLAVLAIVAASAATAVAQTAKEVLDRTAQKLEQKGTAQASFKLTSYSGVEEQGSTSGSLEIKGRKIHLVTPDMQTWFDGKTQWTMLGGSDEVNMQEPTEEEQARMNPYSFISLYRKGYRFSMSKAVLRGLQTFEVTLTAKSKKAALRMAVVNIDQKTYQPICLRLKHDADWVRIAIYDLKLGAELADGDFVFPTEKYPNASIIDLR